MKSAVKRLVSCEPLEERRLFITYQVDGTGGADTISVSIDGNSIISVVNGVSDSASDTINNNIEISGLGGNDIISIIETGANTITINSGSGDDTINIGNGNNDLDFIDDLITVNGEGNTDTVVLFNQNDTTNAAVFTMFSGNQYNRTSVPAITANVENVTIHASSSVGQNFVINDSPTADVTLNGSSTQFNPITLNSASALTGSYRPDDVATNKGTITYSNETIDFTQCDQVNFNGFSEAKLITPNANDIVTIAGLTSSQAAGSSGGVTWAPMFASGSNLTLDLATEDGGAGNDTITGAVGHAGVGTLRVNAGTGNNSLNANGGNWNVTTALGVGGVNLDVVANLATVSFAGFQHLRRLQIDNGGTAQFTGAVGTVLSADTLAVNAGTGRIAMLNGVNGSATNFSIAAGRTLEKTGSGTLNINGTQSHGAGAALSVNNGVLNMFTDAGSAASRTLSVNSQSTINFGSSQHLSALGLTGNSARVNMSVDGNRVLVTGFVSVDTEGAALNLNDNDMILDYSNVADANAVRASLHSGRANGTWSGIGITSNTAATNQQHNTTLASLEATEFKSIYGANATFDGQQLDNTMVLIKYTWYGDTDFNGIVDFDDYSRADAGFNNDRTGWLNGDFDDNGIVDFDDYSLIDLAFNTQGGTLRPGSSSSGREIARILPEILGGSRVLSDALPS